MNGDNDKMNGWPADDSAGDYDDSWKDTNDKSESQYEGFTETSTIRRNRFRLPVWIILFLIFIVILDVVSMIRFPSILSDYKVYKKAESRISNGETSLALNDLYELAEKYPDSTPILTKSIKLCMENGYYDNAGYLMDTYVAGKSLSDSEYELMDRYYKRLDSYYTTYDAIEQLFSTVSDPDTVSGEEYDKLKTSLESLLKEDGQDYAFIYYYLGSIESDTKTNINYLQNCYNTDPECFDVRVQLGVLYRRMGDYETAEKYNKEALEKEKMDSGALRSMAILRMLEGDYESGLNLVKDAYKSDPEGTYVRETYLIALSMNGMEAEAEKIKDEMKESDSGLDDDTLMLLNGDITLENYYVER